MRRVLSPLLATLMCLVPVVLSRAQSGTQISVTGLVAYQGCPYQNGRGRAILVSGNGSGQQAWTTGGTNPVPTPRIITALDSAGKFTLSLTSTALIDQQAAQPMWQFQLCSFNYPSTGEVCFTMTPLALTSSQDISSQIQSQSLPIPGCSAPSGGITFQHNGTVVATEPQYNMIDTGTAVWTVTDDPGNTRVNAQIAAAGGGGGSPAGVLYDVQINDPLGMFGSDTGIGQIIPSLHTFYENILNANQQVDVSDATNSGLFCEGHSTGAAVDSAFCIKPNGSFSPTPTGGYGIFVPDASPTQVGQALRVSSVTPVNVVTKYGTLPFYPTSWDAPSNGGCAGPAGANTYCAGPLGTADPRTSVVQDKMCTIGDTPTCTGGGTTVACSVSTSPTSFAHCQFSIDSPIQSSDTGYVAFTAQPGLGASGVANTMSDTQANTWTRLINIDGSGSTLPTAVYWAPMQAGADTISVNFDTSAGFQFRGTFHFIELRGTVIPDGAAAQSSNGGGYAFQPVTTTNATDTILGDNFIYSASCSYFPGTGFGLTNIINGSVFTTNVSMGGEVVNKLSTGTYTPAITATGSGCSGTTGTAITAAFTTSTGLGPGNPDFRWPRYTDLVAGHDIPSQSGNAGNCLAANANGADYQPLVWATCGAAGVTSIQFKNAGTNFGSPMTGAGSMNFVNATVSGTAPNFTITVSGAGDTITSPNSTLVVGGTPSATTLDLAGAAGEIMAGATPALTRTPALGTDNSIAGTLQMANGSANAHTIWGSAATTSNTILGPATVIANNHIVGCSTSSTTCTLTDLGAVPGGASGVFKTETANYTVLASDFSTPFPACGNIFIGVGAASTLTVTLTSSGTQPAAGQCIEVWIYTSSIVTIAQNGQSLLVGGFSGNYTMVQGMGIRIVSDGTNYTGYAAQSPNGDSNNDMWFGHNIFGWNNGQTTIFGDSNSNSGASGSGNTYIGTKIAQSATSAQQNTVLGYNAFHQGTSGSQNVCIGLSSCGTDSGSGNTVVGSNDGGTLRNGSNNLIIGSNNEVDVPSGSTSNYVAIGNFIYGDKSKGILILKGSATTIAANACGSTTQGTLKSGSNDMSGEVTVGTAAVTTCVVSFANTHNVAPNCVVSDQSLGGITTFGYSVSTTALTITAATGLSGTVVDYFCPAATTSATPTP